MLQSEENPRARVSDRGEGEGEVGRGRDKESSPSRLASIATVL